MTHHMNFFSNLHNYIVFMRTSQFTVILYLFIYLSNLFIYLFIYLFICITPSKYILNSKLSTLFPDRVLPVKSSLLMNNENSFGRFGMFHGWSGVLRCASYKTAIPQVRSEQPQ